MIIVALQQRPFAQKATLSCRLDFTGLHLVGQGIASDWHSTSRGRTYLVSAVPSPGHTC